MVNIVNHTLELISSLETHIVGMILWVHIIYQLTLLTLKSPCYRFHFKKKIDLHILVCIWKTNSNLEKGGG